MAGRDLQRSELDPEVRQASTGDEDPYGFGHGFLQQITVELRLLDGAALAFTAATTLDVCDVRRLGSLYSRLLSARRARHRASGGGGRRAEPRSRVPPWFPVLLIGSDKATLYTRALVADIVDKQRYLTDPAWLVRLGLYLELLTCLGIAEAVRDEFDDLLTSRGAGGVRLRALRRDPSARRRTGVARSLGAAEIAFPRRGVPRAGPVSILNLLGKKRATLEFLRVHHDDLKRAIELAGPNPRSGQETWHRVFRDAERAVMRQTPAAFPELGYVPAAARELVLWHRQGRLDVAAPAGRAARDSNADARSGRAVPGCLQPIQDLDERRRGLGRRAVAHGHGRQ